MKKILYFLITILIGFSSCTISKRQHQPGFYFGWHHSTTAIKEIHSNKYIPLQSALKTEITTADIEEKNLLQETDTIPPPSSSQIQSPGLQTKQVEIPKEELMKIEAKNIQVIHRMKQLVTAGGLFGVVMGSFYFATAYSVLYPFLGVLLLIALFAAITAIMGLIITIKVKKFKKKYPEFSETPEFKKVLKARKRARISLYFSYGLISIDFVLALFAVLIELFSF